MTQISNRPINRPQRAPAPDLNAPLLENVDFGLYELLMAAAAAGSMQIEGRTFRGCRIEGPAILLVGAGVYFNDTNFGDGRGDVRNLLLQPVGDKAIGTIPMRNCTFDGCEFYGVGFTGNADFIAEVSALQTLPAEIPGPGAGA